MNTLLIGCKGNMGARYSAILNFLDIPFIGIDLNWGEIDFSEYDKIILATPTETHFSILMELRESVRENADILCEKPVVTTESHLNRLLMAYQGCNLYMVNQYRYLLTDNAVSMTGADSHYNYFRTGQDGLAWDCIQIIGLANGPVYLENNSPIWRCEINGFPLSIAAMDLAYVNMIQDFLGKKERLWGHDMIRSATEKVLQFIESSIAHLRSWRQRAGTSPQAY